MGARLRLLSRGRNLTQAQLSKRSGIVAGYIRNFEWAEANSSAPVLIALAHAVQVEVGKLFPTLREIASASSTGVEAGPNAGASLPGIGCSLIRQAIVLIVVSCSKLVIQGRSNRRLRRAFPASV